MSAIQDVALRAFVSLRCLVTTARRSEAGQSTAEYGIVVLVAIALGTAVLMLFTGGQFDNALKGLLSKVLSTATSMIKGN